MSTPYRLRLLQDIAEIQTKPYPGIALHVQDGDISTVCLVLTVKGYGAMHLTIIFRYGLSINASNDSNGLKSYTSEYQGRRSYMYLDSGYEDGLYPSLYLERNCCSIIELLLW